MANNYVDLPVVGGGGGSGITQLTGEVTAGPGSGSQGAIVSNAAVIAKVLTGYLAGAGAVSATDSILSAIQKLDGNSAAISASAITSLTGEGTATGPGAAALTLSNAAVIAKTLTSYVAGAGVITPADSIFTAIQKLSGNIASISGSALTGLTGDVVATGPGSVNVTILNAVVTGKAITGFVSGSGTLSPADSILTAINKLDGNILVDNALIAGKVNKVGDTMTGPLVIDQTAGSGFGYKYTVGGLARWSAVLTGAETGSNAGSDLVFANFNDAGTAINTGMTITRGTGAVTIPSGQLTVSGNTILGSGSNRSISFGVINTGSSIALFGSQRVAIQTITANYTVDTTQTSYVILCNHTAAITITLPTATSGRTFIVKDITGKAATFPITVSGAVTIDGMSSYVITQNYAAVQFVSNGTLWFVL